MGTVHWILTADEHGGRLIKAELFAARPIHVDVEDEIHETSHSTGRHTTHRTPDTPDPADHSDDAETESQRQRFAHEIAVWLEQRAEDLHIERLDVIAPDRFLDALRQAWSPRMAVDVHDHRGAVQHLNLCELARHPSIVAMIARGTSLHG